MDAQAAHSADQNAQVERMAKEAAERQERISSAAMDNMADVAKTVAQRLARYLVELASPDIGPAVVMLPYPRAVLAELIGVSPEKLSRNFTVLKDFGVSSRGRRVIIEDTTRLESFYADRKSQA